MHFWIGFFLGSFTSYLFKSFTSGACCRCEGSPSFYSFLYFMIVYFDFFCFQIFTSGACRWYESAPFRDPQRQIQFSAVLQSPQGAPGRCVAACCSVLQHVAACCNVAFDFPKYYSLPKAHLAGVLQRVAACCSAAACCSELQCVAVLQWLHCSNV